MLRDGGEPVTVTVLDFQNSAGVENLGSILADLLATDLAQTPSVRVLGRERMRELQKQLDILEVNETTGFELARFGGVQVLITGTAVRVGDRIRVDAGVYDVATKELLFARNEVGDDPNSVFDMVDDLSSSIRKELKVLPIEDVEGEPSLKELTTASVDAYRLYSEGMKIRLSQPLQAVEYLKEAVALDPEFTEAHLELALQHKYQLGDNEAALASVRRAKDLSRGGSGKELLKSLVYEAWLMERWEDVIKHMKEYLELQPNDIKIQRRLGWVYARRPDTYGLAIDQLRRTIELDPENVSGEIADAYNHLGNLYTHLGMFDEAIKSFTEYKSLAPGRPDPGHSLGNCYMLSGRYETAIEQFKEIVDRFPKYYISHESIGLTYMCMGRWRDALTSFRHFVAVAPGDYLPDCYTRIAEVYNTQREYRVAESELQKALNVAPHSVRAHWMKGVVAIESGTGLEVARRELRIITDLMEDPRCVGLISYVHHLEGMIYLVAGNAERGIRALRAAVDTAERFDSYFFRRELTRGCLSSGRLDECIEEALSIIERNPNDAEVLSVLGFAHKRKGNDEQKTATLERARQVWKEADEDFVPLTVVLEELR
jgi:tetratricopeptide (TPR) repeat protein/TolB-like protein